MSDDIREYIEGNKEFDDVFERDYLVGFMDAKSQIEAVLESYRWEHIDTTIIEQSDTISVKFSPLASDEKYRIIVDVVKREIYLQQKMDGNFTDVLDPTRYDDDLSDFARKVNEVLDVI